MADVVITPGNTVQGSGVVTIKGKAGATITAGQLVYREAATSKFKAVDSDSATSEARTPVGIALNGASDGQPLEVQTAGEITIGGTLVVGTIYVASDTAGGIMPAADLETGDYVTVVGVAKTAAILKIGIIASGVAVP